MVVDTKVTTTKARSTEKVHTHGRTVLSTMGTGTIILLKATVPTHGWMVASIQANGRITICMAKDHTCGATVVNTKDTMSLTKNTGTVCTNGQTDASMREIGPMANSTDEGSMFLLMEK